MLVSCFRIGSTVHHCICYLFLLLILLALMEIWVCWSLIWKKNDSLCICTGVVERLPCYIFKCWRCSFPVWILVGKSAEYDCKFIVLLQEYKVNWLVELCTFQWNAQEMWITVLRCIRYTLFQSHLVIETLAVVRSFRKVIEFTHNQFNFICFIVIL